MAASAAPISTASAVGGFLSWRDCNSPDQAFCDGGLGGSNPLFNNGSGDRSITGGTELTSLSDAFFGAPNIGGSTYSTDMMNASGGVSISATANTGPEGRTAASVGGYSGLVYTGAVSTTKTLNITFDYEKVADGDQFIPGSGASYANVALVRTASNSIVGDPDNHFMGEVSMGFDLAFEITDTGTAALNTVTYFDLLQLNDPAVGAGTLTGALSIALNPGDVFFIVAYGQAVGNQTDFTNSWDLVTGFSDTSDLEALTVPAPMSGMLLIVGLLAGVATRRRVIA